METSALYFKQSSLRFDEYILRMPVLGSCRALTEKKSYKMPLLAIIDSIFECDSQTYFCICYLRMGQVGCMKIEPLKLELNSCNIRRQVLGTSELMPSPARAQFELNSPTAFTSIIPNEGITVIKCINTRLSFLAEKLKRWISP